MRERLLHIERTPWRDRRIIWPGVPFRTLPFPYLFHRFDVVEYVNPPRADRSCYASFFRRASAERYVESFDSSGT